MGKRKFRFPHYTSVVGRGSEIKGSLAFTDGLHVDGHIVGDVIGEAVEGKSRSSSAMTLSASGVIEGNLNVPHVVIDGTVIGDVRAVRSAVLASGARIKGTVYYGTLEMDEGAEVNGQLVHIDEDGDWGTVEALPSPVEGAGPKTKTSSSSDVRSGTDPEPGT